MTSHLKFLPPRQREGALVWHQALTRVRFDWVVAGQGTQAHEILAEKALKKVPGNSAAIVPPREVKLPLLVAGLPTAIAARKLVPQMKQHKEVACRCLAIPKPCEEELATTYATIDGKRAEYSTPPPPLNETS